MIYQARFLMLITAVLFYESIMAYDIGEKVRAAGQIYIKAQDLPEGLPAALDGFPSIKPQAVVEQFKISNRYQVYFQRLADSPMVYISIIYGVGSSDDLIKTKVIARMLSKGSGDYDHYSFAHHLGVSGIKLEVYAGTHFTTIRYSVPKAKLLESINLMNTMMRYPHFKEDGLENAIKELKVQAKAQQYSASYLAGMLWERLVFGKSHLWATQWIDKKDLDKLNSIKIRGYYNKKFLKTLPVFSVIGDIDRQQVENIIAQGFVNWPDNGRAFKTVNIDLPFTPEQYKDKTIHLIDVPKSQQVELRAGVRSVSLFHKDWPALFVLADILGGRDGRLYYDLREKQGLSYGVYSYLSKNENADGYFKITGSTQVQKLPKFIAGIDSHWRQLAETLSEEEVKRSKSKLIGSHHIRKKEYFYIRSLLEDYIKTGKRLEIDKELYENIAKLSLHDIETVAKRYTAFPFYWVISGDADKIKPKLKKGLPDYFLLEYSRELK